MQVQNQGYRGISRAAMTKDFLPASNGGKAAVLHMFEEGDFITVVEMREVPGSNGRFRASVSEPVCGWVSIVANDHTTLFRPLDHHDMAEMRRKKAGWNLWC